MNRLSFALLAFCCWLFPSIALAQVDPPPDAPPLTAVAPTDLPDTEDARLRIGRLLTEFGRELAGLPSTQTALTLAFGGASAIAVHPIDDALIERAAHTGGGGFDRFLAPGDVIGAGWFQGSAALGTFVIGQATGNRRAKAVGLDLVQADGIVYMMTKSLKSTVGRARPDGGRHSFPSGHAAATFASATVIHRHFGWMAGLAAYGVGTYVAVSRLLDGKHYASDVIFGTAIGVVAGRTVSIGRGRASFDVTPMSVPGGGGVLFQRAVLGPPSPDRTSRRAARRPDA